MNNVCFLLLFSFVLDFTLVNAQGRERNSVGVFYDQDYTLEQIGLKKLNEDRNYTMGLGFFWSSPSLANWVIYRPHDWLIMKFHSAVKTNYKICSVMFANGSFTPDDLTDHNPILNDRPYASLTYLQASATYHDTVDFKAYTVSFSAGMIGTSISREVQTAIHESMNHHDSIEPHTPRGWGNQISTEGSPSMLLEYRQDYLISKTPLEGRVDNSSTARLGGEFKSAWKASLGWYTMVSGELTYRWGWIDPLSWTYQTNPLGSSNKVNAPSQSLQTHYSRKGRGEAYIFSTCRINAIVYNVLLSGQGGADAVNIPSSWVRHGVLDGVAGICLSPEFSHKTIVDIKMMFNYRSPEFEAPDRAPRWHYWMGIDLLISML